MHAYKGYRGKQIIIAVGGLYCVCVCVRTCVSEVVEWLTSAVVNENGSREVGLKSLPTASSSRTVVLHKHATVVAVMSAW